MAVDELDATVRQAITEKAANVAQLVQRILQGAALVFWMPPPVARMRHEIAGADGDMINDAIADGVGHGVRSIRLSLRPNAVLSRCAMLSTAAASRSEFIEGK